MAYIPPKTVNLAKIKVVGVGGGGQNAVDSMIELNQTDGVEFISMNTDLQVLNASKAQIRLQLGPDRTHGLGSGADPQIGFESATESLEEIKSHLQGSDMVFIAAGFGGGTGTGAAPVVAKAAKDLGALTVGVVTKPFDFEGKRRMTQAEQGIKELQNKLDALIIIPNQKILEVVDDEMPLKDAFKVADQVIGQAVEGISDLITTTGLVNVDFADVKSIMQNAGSALMGIGYSNGENRAEKAANGAVNSPLLDVDIKGCTGLLINIVGDESLSMHEVSVAADIISKSANDGANIIFGANIDPKVDGIKITVIATGFESDFKSVVMPADTGAIRDVDLIDQIDSRFDEIQKDANGQSANDDDDDDNSYQSSNSSRGESSMTTSFDSNTYIEEGRDEDGFNLEKLRQEVARMDNEEPKPFFNQIEIEETTTTIMQDNSAEEEKAKKEAEEKKRKEEERKKEKTQKENLRSNGLWQFIKERSNLK